MIDNARQTQLLMQTTSDYFARRSISGRAQPRKKMAIDRQLIEDLEDESGKQFFLNEALVLDVNHGYIKTRLPHVTLLHSSHFIRSSDTQSPTGLNSIDQPPLHNIRLLQDGRWCFGPYNWAISGATMDDGPSPSTTRVFTETSSCDIYMRPP